MRLLACSVLLLVQISVSQAKHDDNTGTSVWCPNHCRNSYQDNVIQVAPNLIPECTYNKGSCDKRRCDRTTDPPCEKRCFAKWVWKPVKCCRTYWVLVTKKCKCSWHPFRVIKPKEESEKIFDAENTAVNNTMIPPISRCYCPPYHKCEGALVDNVIYPNPDLFPQCTYNMRRCRKQKCGYSKPHKKPCPKTCFPIRVWKKVKCCRIFWRLKTKKCRCRWKPFPVPPSPFKG